MHLSELPPQPRQRLAQARNERRMSQQEVADHIGTSYVNVSRWERGITKPSPYFRQKLSKLFGKTEEELDLVFSPSPDNVDQAEMLPAPPAPAIPAAPSPDTPVYDSAIPLQPPVRLVGRDKALAQIKQRLKAGGNVALTALNGLP